jgi:uncharacterized protein YoxC
MTTRVPDTDETEQAARPDFSTRAGGFLKRLFLAFVKLAVVALVLIALAFGGWLIYREINRSFDSVVTRMDRNTRRIEKTEEDIAGLREQGASQREEAQAFQTAVAIRDEQVAVLEEELGADLRRQDEALSSLDAQADDLIAQTEAIYREIAGLSAGILALQEDITANGVEIDGLGGTVDSLQADMTALDSETEVLQTKLADFSAEDIVRWRRALALFRIWEIVGRAKLRLVENNVGLAAADVEMALEATDGLLAGDVGEAEETLTLVQQRLALAGSGLPDDPVTAARDLETAWEALDAGLAELLGVQLPLAASPAETPLPAATPRPTTTPQPTPTP